MDKTLIRYMDFDREDNLQKKLSFFGQRSSAGWLWATACQDTLTFMLLQVLRVPKRNRE
jgi:hypothetical protein